MEALEYDGLASGDLWFQVPIASQLGGVLFIYFCTSLTNLSLNFLICYLMIVLPSASPWESFKE